MNPFLKILVTTIDGLGRPPEQRAVLATALKLSLDELDAEDIDVFHPPHWEWVRAQLPLHCRGDAVIKVEQIFEVAEARELPKGFKSIDHLIEAWQHQKTQIEALDQKLAEALKHSPHGYVHRMMYEQVKQSAERNRAAALEATSALKGLVSCLHVSVRSDAYEILVPHPHADRLKELVERLEEDLA